MGTTWLFVFYNYFNIDITVFIDLTEIIQLQFPFFALVLLYIVVYASLIQATAGHVNVYGYGAKKRVALRIERFRQHRIYRNAGDFGRNLIDPFIRNSLRIRTNHISNLTQMLIYISICSILLFASIHIDTEASIDNYVIRDLLILSFVLVILFYLIHGTFRRVFNESKGEGLTLEFKLQTFSIAFLVLVIGMGIIYNRALAYDTKHGSPPLIVRMLMKGKSLVSATSSFQSDTVMVYVGQTKNYVFLYNRKNEQGHVIPRSEILDIQFSESPSTIRRRQEWTRRNSTWYWGDVMPYFTKLFTISQRPALIPNVPARLPKSRE
ncbi:hypothetical protein I2I05_08635 [Hymenobacter sp. BT683]|uniref:Uncharacterized protein n=2 Tax=Hymenobacter jeongseonensis TaxID=2791027 RepID=A0ABS0IGI0_9BACT|nr:hypothetical protein [Hymenobacter jeongseonensis]